MSARTGLPLRPRMSSADTSPGRDQRLERFFQRDPATEYAPSSARISPVMPVTPRATFSKENEGGPSRPEFAPPVSGGQAFSSSWSAAIWISSILIVLAGSGLAVYYLIPKAMVLITPYETTEDVAAKYVGRLIVPVDGEGGEVVPVRKIEKIYTSKAAVPASGKALANNQKARGPSSFPMNIRVIRSHSSQQPASWPRTGKFSDCWSQWSFLASRYSMANAHQACSKC